MQETWVWSLGQEDPLKKEMATRSSIFVWKILWKEEPGGLESMGSQRAGHDLATEYTHKVVIKWWHTPAWSLLGIFDVPKVKPVFLIGRPDTRGVPPVTSPHFTGHSSLTHWLTLASWKGKPPTTTESLHRAAWNVSPRSFPTPQLLVNSASSFSPSYGYFSDVMGWLLSPTKMHTFMSSPRYLRMWPDLETSLSLVSLVKMRSD